MLSCLLSVRGFSWSPPSSFDDGYDVYTQPERGDEKRPERWVVHAYVLRTNERTERQLAVGGVQSTMGYLGWCWLKLIVTPRTVL